MVNKKVLPFIYLLSRTFVDFSKDSSSAAVSILIAVSDGTVPIPKYSLIFGSFIDTD